MRRREVGYQMWLEKLPLRPQETQCFLSCVLGTQTTCHVPSLSPNINGFTSCTEHTGQRPAKGGGL